MDRKCVLSVMSICKFLALPQFHVTMRPILMPFSYDDIFFYK